MGACLCTADGVKMNCSSVQHQRPPGTHGEQVPWHKLFVFVLTIHFEPLLGLLTVTNKP